MPTYEQHIRIAAPASEVWEQIQRITDGYKIVLHQAPVLHISQVNDELYYIYHLVGAQDSTRLRVLATRNAQVIDALLHAASIEDVLRDFPEVGISMTDQLALETHVQEIQTLSEKPMSRIDASKVKNDAAGGAIDERAQPFGRGAVTVMTLLFGVIVGGFLVAINWTRFGKPERAIQAAVFTIVGFPLLTVIAMSTMDILGASALVSLLAVYLLPSIIMVGFFDRWQTPFQRAWVAQHGRQPTGANGCAMYLLVIIVGWGVAFGVVAPLNQKIYASVQTILPQRVYEQDGIKIAYPLNLNQPFNEQACTSTAGVECLISASDSLNTFSVMMIISKNPLTVFVSLEEVEAQLWAALQGNDAQIQTQKQETFTIDGIEAIRRDITQKTVDGMNERITVGITSVTFKYKGGIYWLHMSYLTPNDPAVEKIINSLEFAP